ncbi:hypothetical protein HGRIS_002308 [Hohenbuehelia grisea]|uniref:FAD-binding domain-containing protein n=1 Tax=Hohenbuehelia grisea TaxID=104357 RepID=A0ABR3JL01_9AGAR
MSPTKVIIIGCGIAGPVLAMFLKMKGYGPIIYERLEDQLDAGIGIMLQTNGLRVLSLIPGLIDKLKGQIVERAAAYSILPEETALLGDTDAPRKLMLDRHGFGLMGIRRTLLLHTLIAAAEERGVQVVRGHELTRIQQKVDCVIVTFKNGNEDTGGFVVGCDGLHSNTRVCLFGQEQADFTGLTQMGGVAPTPEALSQASVMVNYFADGAHMISYPISQTHTGWAITRREPELKESWRSLDDEKQTQIKTGEFSTWPFGAGELVKHADRIVKYGLYDRPELAAWHKDRVVLLGDAAHPTSPHLGQGANQAFEDVYHLVRVLLKYNPDAGNPDTAALAKAFEEYENVRIPRSATLVKAARKMGDLRVTHGVENCLRRNEAFKHMGDDLEVVYETYKPIVEFPFLGESEI